MTSQIRVDEITNRSGLGTVTIYDNGFEFTGVTTFTEDVDITGGLTIGGVLTYEDVTNIDSVGIITARSGIHVTGDNKYLKIGAGNDISLVHTGAESFITNATGHLTRRSDVHKWENYDGSSEYFRITSDGKMALGIASPARGGLHIHKAATAELHLTDDTTGSGSGDGFTLFSTSSSAGVWYRENAPLRFATYNTERVRISSGGNVGINDTAPSEKLNVGGNIMLEGSDQYLYLTNVGTGNAGVYIRGRDATSELRSHSTGMFTWEVTGSEKMRLDSSGRLLLGTTTEGQVNADNLTVADSGNCGITIRSGTTSSCNLYFSDATSGTAEFDGAITYQQSDNRMMFYTSSTERLRIDSAGNIGVGGITSPAFTTGGGIHLKRNYGIGFGDGSNGRPDFQIATTNGSTLDFRCGFGADTADISMTTGGNLVFANGGGIDFSATSDTSASNASASSEILDDYEEGTWTPRLINSSGSSANISAQPSNRVGTYCKIGNRLIFNCWITGSLTTTETGASIRIAGLPYNSSSNGNAYSALTIWNYSAFSGYRDEVIVRNNTGDDQIIIQRYGGDISFNDIVKSGLNFMISGQYRV